MGFLGWLKKEFEKAEEQSKPAYKMKIFMKKYLRKCKCSKTAAPIFGQESRYRCLSCDYEFYDIPHDLNRDVSNCYTFYDGSDRENNKTFKRHETYVAWEEAFGQLKEEVLV